MHAYQPERLKPASVKGNILEAFVHQNPFLLGGAALSLVVTGAILVNAIWFQPEKHPSPLFATRDLNVVQPMDERSVATNSTKSTSKTRQVASADDSPELLREIQTALSVRGYYTGKLDGVYGSRTKKAITSFQRDHSLEQDGQASLHLLTRVLLSASASPTEVPVPKPSKVAKKPAKSNLAEKDAKDAKPAAKVAQEDKPTGLVAQIQSGLKAYGYEDLIVDGKMGQQTSTAIQRFQLDYGMKITGEPSPEVLEKLRAIGAARG